MIKLKLFKTKKKEFEKSEYIYRSYLRGHFDTWFMIQICLYDMWKNNELLDYMSFVISISKKLEEYGLKPDIYKTKLTQFNDDIKIRNKMKQEYINNDTNK